MENINILNSIDKLDYILNEDIFNKYNQQCVIMQKTINEINSSMCEDHPDFIKFPDNLLNDSNYMTNVMPNLKKLIHSFYNHIIENNTEIKNILKKINTVDILINIGKINDNNCHIINDFMKTIQDDIDTFIIEEEHNKLMLFILTKRDNTEFLLNYIDENY